MSAQRTRSSTKSPKAPAKSEVTGEEKPRRARRVALGKALPFLLAGVVLAGAIAGYFLFMPQTILNSNALARLLPTKPLIPNMTATPAFNGPIPILPSDSKAITAAANADPGHTAAYSLQWFGTGSNGANEQLTLYLLPTAALARQMTQLQEQQNTTNAALKTAKYTLKSRFSDAAIGASGVAYTIPRKVQNSSGDLVTVGVNNGFTIIAQHGRAVVRELDQGAKVTEAQALAVARQIDAVLTARLGSFPTIASTHYPLYASLIYGAATVVLTLLAFLSPAWTRRRRAARRIREAERARYQYRVRGAKNLRRHRAPY